jgi:hypothetical protein
MPTATQTSPSALPAVALRSAQRREVVFAGEVVGLVGGARLANTIVSKVARVARERDEVVDVGLVRVRAPSV